MEDETSGAQGRHLPALKVLFLTLYPEVMPSSRLRVYQYLPLLRNLNIEADVLPTVPDPLFSQLYFSTAKWSKIKLYASDFFRFFKRLDACKNYDVIYVQKGISLSNFRGLDRFLSGTGKPLIYDIDDDLYGAMAWSFRHSALRFLQDPAQPQKISQASRRIVAGNHYLESLAQQYNDCVSILPTPVDTERIKPSEDKRRSGAAPIIIGWLGVASGMIYLPCVEEALRELSKHYPVIFRVVTRLEEKKYLIPGVKTEVLEWSLENETNEMNRFDIAISPMDDNPWARGKCSLKLLQYMAAGLPTVSSAVGMNCEVIRDGVNGFLAATPEDWISKLGRLIHDAALRQTLGRAARETVIRDYSLTALAIRLKDILTETATADKMRLHYETTHGQTR